LHRATVVEFYKHPELCQVVPRRLFALLHGVQVHLGEFFPQLLIVGFAPRSAQVSFHGGTRISEAGGLVICDGLHSSHDKKQQCG
jgi:hypothetical protein